jgi:hypothetical protein
VFGAASILVGAALAVSALSGLLDAFEVPGLLDAFEVPADFSATGAVSFEVPAVFPREVPADFGRGASRFRDARDSPHSNQAFVFRYLPLEATFSSATRLSLQCESMRRSSMRDE